MNAIRRLTPIANCFAHKYLRSLPACRIVEYPQNPHAAGAGGIIPITHEFFIAQHQALGGSAKRSLPMVCPFAIGKTFGLAAATRRYETPNRNRYQSPFISRVAQVALSTAGGFHETSLSSSASGESSTSSNARWAASMNCCSTAWSMNRMRWSK